jgi:hypothetical protein
MMLPLHNGKLPENACADDAHAYLIRHDDRVRHLDAMSDAELARLYIAVLRRRGMVSLTGTDGWSHDELVSAVTDLEFPDTTLAREIWYRNVQMPAIGEV